MKAPRCGDPRWEPKMETLVALAKVGLAVPLPREPAKGGSSWPEPTRNPAEEMLTSLRGPKAVREALSSHDPRNGPGQVRARERSCILIVAAIHPGTGTGRFG